MKRIMKFSLHEILITEKDKHVLPKNMFLLITVWWQLLMSMRKNAYFIVQSNFAVKFHVNFLKINCNNRFYFLLHISVVKYLPIIFDYVIFTLIFEINFYLFRTLCFAFNVLFNVRNEKGIQNLGNDFKTIVL